MTNVYTYGVFDLLHWGHIQSLKEAKALGDKLIVGIFTDEVATSFKRKPILDEDTRKKNIEELGIADCVIFQNELSPQHNIDLFNFNVVAKGEGAGFEDMEIKNCKKVLIPYHEGISTSQIIKTIKERKDL